MTYLLDTSVAIPLAEGDSSVEDRLASLNDGAFLSILTRVELEGGLAVPGRDLAIRRERLSTLLDVFEILPFGDAEADAYRSMMRSVPFSRRKIIDRMIASTALARDAILATLNPADFNDVSGLRVEDWSVPV